jgi:hypothetical protein
LPPKSSSRRVAELDVPSALRRNTKYKPIAIAIVVIAQNRA